MKLYVNLSLCVAALFVLVQAGATPASAETTAKDIKIAARAVAFMNNPPSGPSVAAIISDPANAASKQEAETIQSAMGSGLKAGKAKLTPALVDVNTLDLGGAKVAFLTGGLGSHFEAIFSATTAASVLSISTDMTCVNAGKCVVGIASSPKVEIVVSKAARESAGIGFKSAFLMMVKER